MFEIGGKEGKWERKILHQNLMFSTFNGWIENLKFPMACII